MKIWLLAEAFGRLADISASFGDRAVCRGMLRYIRNTTPVRAMVATKVATLNLRIDPALKEAVRIAALRDHRSIANLVEVLIRQHCAEHGITIPEQQDLSLGSDDE